MFTYYVTSLMQFSFNPVRSLHFRTNESTACDGGVYVHGEVAIVDDLADKEYTSAVGVAFRRDEMSPTARKQRKALLDAAAKGTDEYNRVRNEQQCRAVTPSTADAKRLAVEVETELATA